MTDNESPPPRQPADGTIDEVVERTRSMLRKSRDLLQSSRDLLNKVHQPASRAKAIPEKTEQGDDGRGSP
jgi:hypothetical protein